TEADYPFIRVPLAEADYARANALDNQITELRRRIHAPAMDLSARDGMWSGLTDLDVSAKGCGAEVMEREERDEYLLTGTVPGGVKVTVTAPVPEDLKQLTALRLDALPVDAEKARTVSELGFVLDRITTEIVPAEGGKPVPVKFVRVFSDEPDPFLPPEGSLSGAKRKGFAAFTRMNGPRHAVFVPQQPVPWGAGDSLRIVLAFDTTVQGAFPLVIRHGALSISGDPAWTELIGVEQQHDNRQTLADLEKQRKAIPSVKLPVMEELDPPLHRSMQVFVRGNWLTRGEEAPPSVPHSFPQLPAGEKPDRLALARWLVSPNNPLTARVMVNRLWEQVFGTGLVETMEDFGWAGEKPSHPALLDWLAVHFREDLHWSIKAMLRELVLSAAYRQENRISPEKLERDPANRLLARGPRLRLTAEMLRDQALAVSGLVNPGLHGPPAFPPIPEGVWKPFVGNEKWPIPKVGDPKRYRRAVYTHVKRSIPYPGSAVFDAPSREINCQRRVLSNTPVQALTLLNDEVFDEAAAALADRMQSASDETDARLAHGYRLITGRLPDAVVTDRLAKLVASAQESCDDPNTVWKTAAMVLLNLDESLTR
ncbi:MAG: DUF1553 domain-containing protein, partial [Chthoniobacteraceae bacterium]